MPKVEIFETKDGSHSLLLPEMNETYHSTHGALTEAEYVFLDKGVKYWRAQHPEASSLRILEVGFGTGLNAWLTALVAEEMAFEIAYASLEKYPLDTEVLEQLNYASKLDRKGALECFAAVHASPWGDWGSITDSFTLAKLHTDVLYYQIEEGSFDLIYFDAFAPSKQPEMWSMAVLTKMYDALKQGGVLVTYCAQGQFKRDLKSVGFQIEELPGPPGKKEMTRAVKP
ncbi:hypothetical protein BFP72_16515 [Reichenbachiella sp. 5M10]|uniref:tRNA (5-methylaminomethyl-2-thiouridine)(34)-methyltransferase MnmD n=1 Tax=Reichenbachiella sp. 5M10 TaxID=1889772 RepID=UPI000C14FD7C|nr:tRNA (5-methylaminomethyl-2-thiouridine)(34)-methyltransferase MnmD [Reichenbachiella sp. 5M10]PIB36891.1 hypothetical protein BFP72_16515 [Reichenbachiella sp. 5M10]